MVTDVAPLLEGPSLALLLAKMAATAAFVVGVAMLSERLGPFFGAMVASLPLYTGPVYVLLALEHDAVYLAQAAIGSLAICSATAVFALTYCALAQRFGMGASLTGALVAWSVSALAIRAHNWTLPQAFLLCAAVYALAVPASQYFIRSGEIPRVPRRWLDLPLRAGLVAALTAVVTTASSYLSPMATGILSVIPIILSSLILVLHPRIGGPATAALMAHTISGLIGMIVAFAVVHLAIEPLGTNAALLIGLLICVAWNLMLIFARHGLRWLGR